MVLRIGALTTLLALAVDPFTQQLVQLEQKMEYTADGQTTIARAQRYSGGNEFQISPIGKPNATASRSSNEFPVVFADADFSVQSAFTYGLTQPLSNVIQQLPFTCSTGNCTWPTYESLAICSICNDVSSQLKTLDSSGALFAYLDTANSGVSASSGSTAFQLPNGLILDNQAGFPYAGDRQALGIDVLNGVLMTTFGTGNASATNTLQNIDTLLWSMSVLRMRPDPKNSSAAWPTSPLEASECGLYLCVKEYTSLVENGLLQEQEEIKPATRSPSSWKVTEIENEEYLNASLINSLEFDDRFSIFKRTDLMLGNGFNISQVGLNSLSSYFQDQLTTTLRTFNRSQNVPPGKLNGFYTNSTSEKVKIVQYNPSSMSAIFETASLNDTFQSIGRSLSNALREHADDNTVVEGEVGTMKTHYRIVWGWISLHVFVTVAGIGFLGVTMWKSRGKGAPVWKTSSLATLSRGSRVTGLLGSGGSVREMEGRARAERVGLFGREEGGISGGDGYMIPLENTEGDIGKSGLSQSSELLRLDNVSGSSIVR